MGLSHNPWLVLLSLLVAIQGAYVGLSLARELTRRRDHRRLLLAGASGSLATAIWSMHFIGMLAAQLPAPINYLVLPTLLSVLVSALFVGLAIYLASTFPASRKLQFAAAVIMGSGIVAMHFTGMLALHAQAMLHHDPLFVVASWLVGVTASGLAIRFAFNDRGRTPLAVASVALGLAISGMHYTAMAGMTLHAMTLPEPTDAMALSPDALAVVVAVAAFALSAVFLLALVPDHPLLGSAGELKSALVSAGSPTALAGRIGAEATFEPAGGGGAAAGLAVARGIPAARELRSQPVAGGVGTVLAAVVRTAAVLPVQHHGAVRYLPVSHIFAIKADAHYTWVFDGQESYFCGLAIADAQTRLDPERFVRVHRSHIVALDKIASLRKSGDGGIAELDSDEPYALPISRRKISTVKAALDNRAS